MVYIHTTFLNYLNIIGSLSYEVLHFQKHMQIFTDNKSVVQYMHMSGCSNIARANIQKLYMIIVLYFQDMELVYCKAFLPFDLQP